MDELKRAIRIAESGSKKFPDGNDMAIGDKMMRNKAYGCMQVRQPVCDDVNRVYKTGYQAEMCKGNRILSELLFERYMAIWATPKRLGRPVTDQDRARIWNGGPNGWCHTNTLNYWQKVSANL